jgi:hypothetical protein
MSGPTVTWSSSLLGRAAPYLVHRGEPVPSGMTWEAAIGRGRDAERPRLRHESRGGVDGARRAGGNGQLDAAERGIGSRPPTGISPNRTA